MVRIPRLLLPGLLAALLGAWTVVPSAAAWAAPATVLPAAAVATAPPAAAVAAAQYGAGWLARLITATGGYVPSDPTKPTTSAPDPANTANAILALHAAGVGAAAAAAALSWLERNYSGYVHTGGADVPGALATLILVAHTSGVSPTAFGPPGATTNLVARLLATQRTTGTDAGLFGSQSPTYDGAFRQGLALLALSAVGRQNRLAVRWLTTQQCADGGWTAYRASTTAPCPAPNPATFSGPDTNSTSLAWQGLLAEGAAPTTSPLPFLAGAQSSDGGWAYIGTPTTPSDPNSTALVIQALLAAGQNPTSSPWLRGGGTPYDALLRFALGCAAPAPDRGAFYFNTGDGTTKPNVLATVQAVPAAAGVHLPLAPSTPSTAVPVVPCAAPTPTPTPTASGPAGPSPSSSASGQPTAPASSAAAAASQLPDTGPHTPLPLPVLAAIGALLVLGGGGLLVATRPRGRRAR